MNLTKEWSDDRLLRLNIDKCKTVSYCLKCLIDTSNIIDKNQIFSLEKVNFVADLGVHFDSKLTF